MIHVVFVEPNFRYRYQTSQRAPGQHVEVDVAFAFARDEDELRNDLQRLRREAIAIEKYDFSEWRNRAAHATSAAIFGFQQGKSEFDSSIWSCIKTYLFTLFHRKCAYCETAVGVSCPGDVEHYRPKRTPEGAENHPGYYWLAYDISNLLPCCENCNRFRGKRNQFPIEGVRCCGPNSGPSLESERPLLLNPYFDHDIDEHIRFWTCKTNGNNNLGVGTVWGITPKGDCSVKVYNLQREPLNDARAKAQVDAIDALRLALVRGDEEFFQRFESFCNDRCEYSAAVKAYVCDWWCEFSEKLSARTKKCIESTTPLCVDD